MYINTIIGTTVGNEFPIAKSGSNVHNPVSREKPSELRKKD
jgi:hypothetical protein